MDVQVKTSGGISLIPVDTRLLADRQLFLEGSIDQEKAVEFTKKIMLLNREEFGAEQAIDLFINSPGGEISAGMLIYDVIQSSKAPIRTWCLGQAYSMAALLFASGSHGRYMLPHSELMLHEPLLGNRVAGNASSIQSISDSLLETKKRLCKILAVHTKKTEKEIEAAIAFDHYFTAEEAVEFGLADKIRNL